MDCYKYLGDIYSAKASNVEQQALRETFLSNMGWLKGSLLNANNEADVFQCFLKLSDSDRRGIAKEVKNAWALSEGIRDSFQILVTDFLTADAARLKKGIYARAQTVTEDILQQYLISVNDDLVLSSTAESKDPAVKVNFGALRMTLHSEIKREAQSFLYLMRNVLEKGVEFLTGIMHCIIINFTLITLLFVCILELHSGKHGLRNEDGKEDMASVLGFLSEEDILLLFEESFHNSLASFSVASAADETSSYAVVEEDIIATEASEIKQDISNAYVNDQKFDNAKKSTKRSTRKSSKKRRETAANGKKQAKNLSNNWDILWSALYFCGTTICAVAGAAWVGHTFKKARQQTVKSTNKVLLKPSTLLRRRYSSGNGSKTVETDTTKKLSYLQVLKENLLVFCEEVFNILALTFLSAKTFLLLIAGNVLLTVQHLIDTSSFSKNELNVSVEDTDNKLKLSKSAKLKQKASRSTSESYPVDRVVSPELNKSPKKTSKKRRFSHKNSEDLTEEKLEQAFISPDTDQKLGQPDSPSSVTYAENIFDDGQGWELVEKGGKVKSHSTSHKGFSEEKKDHSNFEGTRNGRALSHDSVGSIPTCESPELHSFPAVYVKNSKLSASAVLVSNSDNTLESSYNDDLPQELVEQLKEMDRVEFNCLSNENEDEGWICAGSKQKKHSKSVHQYSSQKVSGAVCVSTKKESVSAPTNNSKEFFNKKELGRKLLQSISQKKLPVAQEAENGYVRPGVAVSDGKAKGVPEATNSHQRISVGTPALHSGSITTNEDHEQSSISDMSINSGGEVVGDHIQMPMMQPVPMPMHIPMAMPLVPAQYLMMQQHYLMQQAHAMSAVSPMPLMHGYPIPMSPSPGFSYNGVAMPNDMNPFDGAAHFYGSQDEYHQGPQTSADGASPTLDSVDPYRSFSCTSGTGDIIDATRRQM